MAYRELGVIELREVLRRFCGGEGLHAIARGTGVDRKTVAKYVAAGLAVGLCVNTRPSSRAQGIRRAGGGESASSASRGATPAAGAPRARAR